MIIVIIILFISFQNPAFGQKENEKAWVLKDSISYDEFDSLIRLSNHKFSRMESGLDSLDALHAITSIRLYNTMVVYHVKQHPGLKDFIIYFNLKYTERIDDFIEGVPTYGHGVYSKKYEITIGGMLADVKSRFVLVKGE